MGVFPKSSCGSGFLLVWLERRGFAYGCCGCKFLEGAVYVVQDTQILVTLRCTFTKCKSSQSLLKSCQHVHHFPRWHMSYCDLDTHQQLWDGCHTFILMLYINIQAFVLLYHLSFPHSRSSTFSFSSPSDWRQALGTLTLAATTANPIAALAAENKKQLR